MSMSKLHRESVIWIYIELLPLPEYASSLAERHLWWSPDLGEICGEHASEIQRMIQNQIDKGSVKNAQGTFEVTDPLRKSTELASVLGQFYWVLPVPVSAAYERPHSEPVSVQDNVFNSLH